MRYSDRQDQLKERSGEEMQIKLWEEGAPYTKGDNEEPSIIPYLVESNGENSAIIICPGGGYTSRAEHEGEPVARFLNALGISAFVLNYRVAPYKHPCPLLDAQRAVRYVRFHAVDWNIDKKRIGILGFSAGGHLASTVGTHFDLGNAENGDPIERTSCRPDLMILCYPVITFKQPYRHSGSMVNLLGEDPDDSLLTFLSNDLQVTKKTPPAFIWHTADDEAVPAENSLLFAKALSQHCIPYELHIFEHGNHGLGLANDDDSIKTWKSQCESWFRKHEFLPEQK